MNLPSSAQVVEVGPRDGLQNERAIISTSAKTSFIDALSRTGLRRIEVSSFVHPKAIPQLADAEEVLAAIERQPEVRYSALVPNSRGLDRALRCQLDQIAVFTGATESFVEKNLNMSIADSLKVFRQVARAAIEAGLSVRGYVSTVFGCPYEGEVKPERGIEVAVKLLDMGCSEISIGDTIGVATPGAIAGWLDAAAGKLPFPRLAMHFHDTRGTALANVITALEAGITTFDASAGGLGGCPYAPGASGNLATEDLVYTLHGSGVETAIDLDALLAASRLIAKELDHPLPGRYYQAEQSRRSRRGG